MDVIQTYKPDSKAWFSSPGWCEQLDHPVFMSTCPCPWRGEGRCVPSSLSLSPAVALPPAIHLGSGDGCNNIAVALKPNRAEEMLILPPSSTRCQGKLVTYYNKCFLRAPVAKSVVATDIHGCLRVEALNAVDFQVVTVQGKRRW